VVVVVVRLPIVEIAREAWRQQYEYTDKELCLDGRTGIKKLERLGGLSLILVLQVQKAKTME